MDLSKPKIFIMKPTDFNKKFHKEFRKGMVGEATTKISNKGLVRIYLKDKGDDQQTDFNLSHELWELKEWNRLLGKGIAPRKASIIAHNKNPYRNAENLKYQG